jgi:hypothetical protein
MDHPSQQIELGAATEHAEMLLTAINKMIRRVMARLALGPSSETLHTSGFSLPSNPRQLHPHQQTCMDGPLSARAFLVASASGSGAVTYPAFVRGTLTAGPEGVRVVGIPNHSLVL